ncbi:MAG: NADH-quinone oxidoreductase subunit G [Thiothrix sp.]|nr:MAG: NADH-quinone oxidoreductase subunit G [Thiothrix sp.]
MSELIKMRINDVEVAVSPGSTIIEAADQVGIEIPRFCYHKKLSVSANCRMCMVEVEKAPKPLPACATPVAEGMQVFTASDVAQDAQKGTMEFLLINHPLDCPICDQGGECELQDVAVDYGSDVSRYSELKRIVPDPDLGPLISTDMNRCIHCTRCVRFGEEVAGQREMGATGRGEFVKIGTFIEKNVDSELSGNIIDLCPVGALTAKPSRFKFRPWELIQHDGVAAHDCMGSNTALHCNNGKITRVVPRDNEAINECWLSDRDRFSYQGVYSADRVQSPMIKEGDGWREVSWETALNTVTDRLKSFNSNDIGALISPNSTLEEMYLAQKYLRGLGVSSIDHRLRQSDFNAQDDAPLFPWLGVNIDALENQDAVLMVGADVRRDQPIAGLRLRKAALSGGQMMAINPRDYEFSFDLGEHLLVNPQEMIVALGNIANHVLTSKKAKPPTSLNDILKELKKTQSTENIASTLLAADNALILLGTYAINHPAASVLSALATVIAANSNIRLGYLSQGANAAGGWLAGVLPHRSVAGESAEVNGKDAHSMLENSCKAYFLMGLEPEFDTADPELADAALSKAEFIVSLSPYANDYMREIADVILPIGSFAETSGTFVNAEGRWQGFSASIAPMGESRPAWKIIRVLGNLADLDGFEFVASTDVLDEIKTLFVDQAEFTSHSRLQAELVMPDTSNSKLMRISDIAIYATDAIVRRASALQSTHSALDVAYMNAADAKTQGVSDSEKIKLSQNRKEAQTTLVIDNLVPKNCVLVPMGTPSSAQLSDSFGSIEISKGDT